MTAGANALDDVGSSVGGPVRFLRGIAFLIAGALSAACASCSHPPPPVDPSSGEQKPSATQLSVEQWLRQDVRLRLFVRKIDEAGLWSLLRGPGPITVFAPRNTGRGGVDHRLTWRFVDIDKARLSMRIRRHIVPERIPSDAVLREPFLRTLADDEVLVVRAGGWMSVDGVAVVERDIIVANGVIHIIDAPLDEPKRPTP